MKKSFINRSVCAVAIFTFNLSGLAYAESSIDFVQGVAGLELIDAATSLEAETQARLTTPAQGNTAADAESMLAAAIGLDTGTEEEGDAGASDQQAAPADDETAATQDVPDTTGGAAESEAAFAGISNISIAIGIGVAAALAAIGGGGGGSNSSTSQHP